MSSKARVAAANHPIFSRNQIVTLTVKSMDGWMTVEGYWVADSHIEVIP